MLFLELLDMCLLTFHLRRRLIHRQYHLEQHQRYVNRHRHRQQLPVPKLDQHPEVL
jgi:hypothetical protein